MKKFFAFIMVALSLVSLSVMAKETFETKTVERSKSGTNPGNNWIDPMGEDDKQK